MANYRLEKQALKQKDAKLFRQVLSERAQLIEKLSKINKDLPDEPDLTPFSSLQLKEIDAWMEKIDAERRSENLFGKS